MAVAPAEAQLPPGSTVGPLADAGSLEIGPALQQYDGTVVWFGGTPRTVDWDARREE